MSKLRPTLRLYVAGVIAGGIVAFGAAAEAATPPDPGLVVPFVALLALACAAQLWPVHVSAKYKVTVEDVATFAAALVFAPAIAMAVAGTSTLVALRFRGRMSWYNRAFNAAVGALGAGAAAVTYLALAGPDLAPAANPTAVAGAAVAKYFSETGLVDLAVALQLRRDPVATWWSVHRRDIGQHAALYALGVLAAVSATTHPWALALFAVPTGVVLLTLRESARLRQQTKTTILELADLIDLRDPYTYGHSQRVAALAERLARRLRLSPTQVELVREGARLHDIGKIGTDDHVLRKPGPLTESELVEMRKHAEFGAALLRTLPEFWEGATLVLAHHERWDGTGYPRGLGGDEIPLEAAIVAVADAYDAMRSDRPYRPALSWEQACAELARGRGAQWHPGVVDALVEMLREEEPLGAPLPRRAIAGA